MWAVNLIRDAALVGYLILASHSIVLTREKTGVSSRQNSLKYLQETSLDSKWIPLCKYYS